MASNVPAVAVTLSLPPAVQAMVISVVDWADISETTVVPCRSMCWFQVSPAEMLAGRVTPVRSLVWKSELVPVDCTWAELPPEGVREVRLPEEHAIRRCG